MASAPEYPDPSETAKAQAKENISASAAGIIMNNMNEYNPTGSVEYEQTGVQSVPGKPRSKVPTYQRTVTLSPEQQHLYDQQTQLAGDMNDFALGRVDHLDTVLGEPADFAYGAEGRARVEDALMARHQPWLDQDQTNLSDRLVNEGYQRGTDAYEKAMLQHSQRVNDARNSIIAAGGQEQALQNQFAALPSSHEVNMLSALMNGGQYTMPQFAAPYQQGVAPADYAGEVANKYQADMANYQSKMGGLFGLGNTVAGGLFGLGKAGMKG